MVSYVEREWHFSNERHYITSYDLSYLYVELWIWITLQNQRHHCGTYSFLVIMWVFVFFSIPLLNVFCKLYVHKYNSFWQIRAWVNSVCVFYSKTLLKISLATCINNWVILHVWTDFCKRLENIAVNLLTYFHVYCIYLSGHIKPARILRGIDFALSDDFEIWCWNCSDSLVCFDFHIINGTQFV